MVVSLSDPFFVECCRIPKTNPRRPDEERRRG